MADNTVRGLPGVREDRTATPRNIVFKDPEFLSNGKVIAGSVSRDPLNTGDLDVLRAGVLMGEITSTYKYAPSVLGVLASAYDKDGSANTTMTVSAATAVELNRRIGSSGDFQISGPPSANGTLVSETVTYSAVNVTTGVITVSAAAADYVACSLIQPTDGSETIKTLIFDAYGIKVTDSDEDNIDVQYARVLVGGEIDASQIVNYGTDTSVQGYIQSALGAVGRYIFDDDF